MSNEDEKPKKDETTDQDTPQAQGAKEPKEWSGNLDDTWSILVASGKGGGDGAVY